MEDVVVNIVANVHSFNQGLLAAGTAFARFSQQLLSDVAKTANAQQQFADSITETYQGLRGLQYAAGTTGVGVEAFNQALTRMNATIGKAAIGNQDAADTLNDLGLNVKELIKLAPQDQFKAIADAVAKVPAGAQRAALTIGIFGKESRQLVNILSGGKAGVEDLMKRFDMLHGTVSRFDVAGIDAGRQALEDMGVIVEGLVHKFANELYPWFKVGLSKLEEWGLTGEKLGPTMDAAFEWLYDKTPAAIGSLTALWSDFNSTLKDTAQLAKNAGGLIAEMYQFYKAGGPTGSKGNLGGSPIPFHANPLGEMWDSVFNPPSAREISERSYPGFWKSKHPDVSWGAGNQYGNDLTSVSWGAGDVYGGLREGTPGQHGFYGGALNSYDDWLLRLKGFFSGAPSGGALGMAGATITSGGSGKYGIPGMMDVVLQQSADMERAFQAQRDRAAGGGITRGKSAALGFGIDLSGSLVSAQSLARASQEVQEVTDKEGNRILEKIYTKIGMGAVAS